MLVCLSGPRRQGPGRPCSSVLDREQRRVTRHAMNRLATAFARAREKARCVAYLPVRGDPRPRHDAVAAGGGGRGRRRRDRTRHALQRSDRRRPGDPARERARAGRGHDACAACSRPCAGFASRATSPHRAVRLLQPDPRARRSSSSATAAKRRRRRRLARRRPAAGRSRLAADRAARHTSCDFVPLVAPTTPDARIDRIARIAGSFLYYVSLTGVTGAETDLMPPAVRAAALRERTGLPVAVGFGVKTPEHARKVARHADGVIVGAAVCSAIEQRRRRPRRWSACVSWSAACAPRARAKRTRIPSRSALLRLGRASASETEAACATASRSRRRRCAPARARTSSGDPSPAAGAARASLRPRSRATAATCRRETRCAAPAPPEGASAGAR